MLRRAPVLAALLAVIALLLAWGPFLSSMDVVVRHFDCPNYLVVAKTLYVPTAVNPMPGYAQTPVYFAAHTPLYPLVLRACSLVAGWKGGLFLATGLLAVASAWAFALYAKEATPEIPVVLATLAFLFLPARMYLYRALGASEALMSLLVILAVLAWRRGRVDWALFAAALATVTRMNGILVVAVLCLALLFSGRVKTAFLGGALAAVPLLVLCSWHRFLFGDFFALRLGREVADSPGRLCLPFAFIGEMAARNDWETAEMLLALHLFFILCAARLWMKGDRLEAGLIAAHVALFSLLRERDLARYYLTVTPFAVVVAWRDVWSRPRVATAVLVVLAPLSVFYAWKTIPMNLCSEPAYRALLSLLAS
ncbi:MAG: hypothetical protein NEA02_10385 [Thermoanaerobaculia bacterium]|nr:hypothetical protein [Thermoanaerobaculia bacterium]